MYSENININATQADFPSWYNLGSCLCNLICTEYYFVLPKI